MGSSSMNEAAGTRRNGPISSQPVFDRHCRSAAEIAGTPDAVFAYVDDQARLSSHMSKRSWMMAGSRMDLELDSAKGQSVGSRIRMSGRVLGIRLSLDEVVTERIPPHRKVWVTIAPTRLLIIGDYRMGFDIDSNTTGSRLAVFIDYSLPATLSGRILGMLFAGAYARWCTDRMVKDAAAHFAQST